jgi:hypothetical protein
MCAIASTAVLTRAIGERSGALVVLRVEVGAVESRKIVDKLFAGFAGGRLSALISESQT